MMIGPEGLVWSLAVTALLILGWWIRHLRLAARKQESLALLRRTWGQPSELARDLEACRDFALAVPSDGALPAVDEHTWLDLDMDAVYARLDRTCSSSGQLCLYRLLRHPRADDVTLARRERLVGLFQSDSDAREAVQLTTTRAGFSAHAPTLVSLLWQRDAEPIPRQTGLRLMAALGLVSVAAPFYASSWGLLLLVATFVVNGLLHVRLRARYEPEIHALRHLGAILAAARELARQKLPGLAEQTESLVQCSQVARPIARGIASFFSGAPADLLYEYFNIQLLLEARGLQRTLRALPVARPALQRLVLTVGELDALQAVASFRAGAPYFCTPDFADEGVALEAQDLVHPLVSAPRPNSVALGPRGVLVTGANMSGKSTFLRALGINALLAQTIHTCCARRYRASRLRVVSCLRSTDDLLGGKSLYWAEAERLLEIVRALDEGHPTLCLIDELLAGTNSAERLAASIAILGFLARKRALVVSATHELDLVLPLRDAFDGYHFTYEATDDGIRFDYRLREGVDRARNAIRLLGLLGFPDEIVSAAQARLDKA